MSSCVSLTTIRISRLVHLRIDHSVVGFVEFYVDDHHVLRALHVHLVYVRWVEDVAEVRLQSLGVGLERWVGDEKTGRLIREAGRLLLLLLEIGKSLRFGDGGDRRLGTFSRRRRRSLQFRGDGLEERIHGHRWSCGELCRRKSRCRNGERRLRWLLRG